VATIFPKQSFKQSFMEAVPLARWPRSNARHIPRTLSDFVRARLRSVGRARMALVTRGKRHHGRRRRCLQPLSSRVLMRVLPMV
jgi:hypothetical protein